MLWLAAFCVQAYTANTSKKPANCHIVIWSYGLRRNADWYGRYWRPAASCSIVILTFCRWNAKATSVRCERIYSRVRSCSSARLLAICDKRTVLLPVSSDIYMCVCFRVIISFDFRTSVIAVHRQTPHFDLDRCKLSKLVSSLRQ